MTANEKSRSIKNRTGFFLLKMNLQSNIQS